MTVDEFLKQVLVIEGLKPDYKLGHSGTDGFCDCIGLIIGAIRRAGGKWTGTHGSNWAARFEVDGLRAVAAASALNRGDLVFKGYEKGDAKWGLPAKYQAGGSCSTGDVRDYYHVGVVYATDPLVIIHCTGPGVVRDTRLGKWGFAASLGTRLEGTGNDAATVDSPSVTLPSVTVTKAAVSTKNGGGVHIRAQPSKKCRMYKDAPCGAEVEVVSTDTGASGWWKVRYRGYTGFALNEFFSVG